MKFIGSTSTESFIPDKNLNFEIINAKDFCNFNVFAPLISNLIRNFLFNLKIGALTGPKIFAFILSCTKDLNLNASFSNLISFSPVKIREINL